MATPTEQALIALQQDLLRTQSQLLEVSTKYDELQGAHRRMEEEYSERFAEKTKAITEMEENLKALLFKPKFDLELLDLKSKDFRSASRPSIALVFSAKRSA